MNENDRLGQKTSGKCMIRIANPESQSVTEHKQETTTSKAFPELGDGWLRERTPFCLILPRIFGGEGNEYSKQENRKD